MDGPWEAVVGHDIDGEMAAWATGETMEEAVIAAARALAAELEDPEDYGTTGWVAYLNPEWVEHRHGAAIRAADARIGGFVHVPPPPEEPRIVA